MSIIPVKLVRMLLIIFFDADVGFIMRNLAKVQTPTVTISIDEGEITIKTETTFKTSEVKFKLGEEFTEKRLDGVDVKVTSD